MTKMDQLIREAEENDVDGEGFRKRMDAWLDELKLGQIPVFYWADVAPGVQTLRMYEK